jgi:hypothetical protein
MKTDALNNSNMVFSFDHSTKIISDSYDTLTTTALANDLHSHGSLFVTSSGTIIVATVSRQILNGNDQGIAISRASINDITTWTPIAQEEIDDDCQYCQISQIDSRIFIYYRQGGHQLKIMYSDDDGATWSTPYSFFDFTGTGFGDQGAYPYGVHNNGGDKIYIIINRRNWDEGVKFPERYYLETSDGVTFTNKAGTWSKDVVTNGYITKAEIEANAMIEQATAQDDIIWNSGGVIGNDGEIYLLSEHENADGLNFTFWNGASWTIRKFMPTQGTYLSLQSRVGITYSGGDSFRIFLLETILGDNQLVSYITNDKGQNWTFEKQYTDGFDHYYRADLTDNIQTSQAGLIATIKGDGTGANSEIFIQEI